jgi:prepilin-type N-terminal cleavage/methylation domain-containing protein
MKRGLTLIETLAVMAIVAILAALLMPALQSALRSARSTRGISNFKQLFVSFSLYRAEYDGEGRYGTAAEMGLPDAWDFNYHNAHLAVSKDKGLWQPACGIHPQLANPGPVYYIYGPVNDQAVANYYKKYEDRAMLLVDENCIDPATNKNTIGAPKLLIGLRLGGQAERKTVYGFPDTLVTNWNE